jgi:hypothetical protein
MSAIIAVRTIARVLPILLLPLTAAAQQRLTLAGDAAIYDLAGQVRLQAGSGSSIMVDVRTAGEDAGKLKVVSGAAGAWQVLRIVFPDDDIVYPAMGRHSANNLDVRENGTFGDASFWQEEGGAGGTSLTSAATRRVHIRGDGSGLRAHADLVIQVPAGHRVAVFVGVGRVDAENVDGRLRVSTSSGDVAFTAVRGTTNIGTGSGDVRLAQVTGDVSAATGSGDVTVQGVHGGSVVLRTGSGDVSGSTLVGTRLDVDTGSGDVKLGGVSAPTCMLRTGSGDIRVGLTGSPETVQVSTGSGDVELALPAGMGAKLRASSGSGDIHSSLPVTLTRRREGLAEGTLGDGRGTVEVSTGSGDIQLTRG